MFYAEPKPIGTADMMPSFDDMMPTMATSFELDEIPQQDWAVVPGLSYASILRGQRIMEMYPGVLDVFISDTPVGRIKKDMVCWDAGPAVLLWLIVPHGIEVPDLMLERLRASLAADPATAGRPVLWGPALGEPQHGHNVGQYQIVRVETWRPGVEWVTSHDDDDRAARHAALAAQRSAEDARFEAFHRLGRQYTEPSYLDI